MREHEKGMEIPLTYLPKCPRCGAAMQIHVPVNQNFVRGSEEEKSCYKNYQEFTKRFHEKKMLILEFGIGAGNQIIKAPFMKIAAKELKCFKPVKNILKISVYCIIQFFDSLFIKFLLSFVQLFCSVIQIADAIFKLVTAI